MKYWILFFVLIISISCSISVSTPVPTETPSITPSPVETPKILATGAPILSVAKVQQPTVNVRTAPDGDPTGYYLLAGDTVTILACVDNWCEIDPLPEWDIEAAWVFIGCLDLGSGKGCIAK